MADDGRSHGVTPELSRDYGTRTAERQAAFVMPHLRAGMHVLDVGCGPGTITAGLAQAVAPGRVVGIDHDATHVRAARALAGERRLESFSVQLADALALPFADASFDAVFENNVFIHLASRARAAADEARRVLKPGGLLAVRDAAADAVVWGGVNEGIRCFDALFHRWQALRGSDIDLGRKLPAIVRAAGFVDPVTSVSADTKGTPGDVQAHAEVLLSLLDGPLGATARERGWADDATLADLRQSLRAWAGNPGAFFAKIHVEVIAWKSGGGRAPAVRRQ